MILKSLLFILYWICHIFATYKHWTFSHIQLLKAVHVHVSEKKNYSSLGLQPDQSV